MFTVKRRIWAKRVALEFFILVRWWMTVRRKEKRREFYISAKEVGFVWNRKKSTKTRQSPEPALCPTYGTRFRAKSPFLGAPNGLLPTRPVLLMLYDDDQQVPTCPIWGLLVGYRASDSINPSSKLDAFIDGQKILPRCKAKTRWVIYITVRR